MCGVTHGLFIFSSTVGSRLLFVEVHIRVCDSFIIKGVGLSVSGYGKGKPRQRRGERPLLP